MTEPVGRLEETLAVLDVGHGASSRACCGGTILVSLRDAGGVTPEPAGHLAFIERTAESPLCVDLEPS